ncbi:hypothetical protein Taro_044660 [Colocasia esculenta]|uniref:Uncharacterized protein n=1 Tax=Colocasia esculenta TaxID=4460 RepID=A0A843X5P7_COLES|nr:hypothetical protein [Colocasia esculenta]
MQGLQPHSLQMYIHRHQLHRQELQSHIGTTRRGRGPSRATIIRILPPGQTVPIDLEGGSSVGPYAQQFTTYLGVCNRVHCNLWQQDYMTLPPEKKEAILRDLQRVSERNKSNRSHLSIPYRRGQTNIHQLSNDFMQKEGRHPTRPEIFRMTQVRTTPDGSVMWSNEQSRQVMDQMTQLMNPTPSEKLDGTAHLAVLSPKEAFRQVFGRDRPGRIRCGGREQTLRSWYGPSEGGSSSNTAYQHLLQEQSQQKSEISQQKSEIERMKKIIEDQEQRISAQSTDIDVRVEAQVEARVEARLAALQTQMLQSMDKRLQEYFCTHTSGSCAPTVPPEDETNGDQGDGEDEGSFGKDE